MKRVGFHHFEKNKKIKYPPLTVEIQTAKLSELGSYDADETKGAARDKHKGPPFLPGKATSKRDEEGKRHENMHIMHALD